MSNLYRYMKKLLHRITIFKVMVILVCGPALVCFAGIPTYEEFKVTIQNELGFSSEEFRILDASISNLLEKGISQEELNKIFFEFKDQGVKRVDFYKDPLDGLHELITRGQPVQESLAFFWQAVSIAKANGLKDKAFAFKVTADLQRKIAVIERLRVEQKINNIRTSKEVDKHFKSK